MASRSRMSASAWRGRHRSPWRSRRRQLSHQAMSNSVSVFGLGYVGCVSAACLAREGHDVVGVDVSKSKVEMINAGTATIVEQGIGELVAEMVKAKKLTATTNVADAVKRTNISLVCVGTPSQAN